MNDPTTVSPFDALLGVEVLSDDPEEARARFEVRDDLKQPYGYLHGGVIPAALDCLCSRATMLQVAMDGNVARPKPRHLADPLGRRRDCDPDRPGPPPGTQQLDLGRRGDRRAGPPLRAGQEEDRGPTVR